MNYHFILEGQKQLRLLRLSLSHFHLQTTSKSLVAAYTPIETSAQ